jgi:hypothetical protein
MNLKKKEIK